VIGGPDVAKISEAVSRPRIDPRKFVELGVVIAVAVDADGAHYDVVAADGSHETVALATPYGGPGYGLYAPTELDEVAVIVVPDGSPNAGGRIVGKVWDPGSPPPAEARDHPEDVALVVKPGQTIRIVVSGGGNAVIEARDGGTVLLGDETASAAAQDARDGADFMAALAAAIATAPTTGAQALAALQTQLQALPIASARAGKKWPVGADRVRLK
jgi:hypothetical protein